MRASSTAILVLPLLGGGLSGCKSEPSIETYIEKYGTESTEPMNKGFVFVNGRYIESPYLLSRRGLVVYVNDVPVTDLPPFHFDPPAKSKPYTEKSKLEACKSDLALLTDYTANGRVHMMFNEGGTGGLYFGSEILPELLSLLRKERESGIRNPELEDFISTPDWLDQVRKNFVENAQLTARLEALSHD